MSEEKVPDFLTTEEVNDGLELEEEFRFGFGVAFDEEEEKPEVSKGLLNFMEII